MRCGTLDFGDSGQGGLRAIMLASRYPVNYRKFLVAREVGIGVTAVHRFDDEESAENFLRILPPEKVMGPMYVKDPDAEPYWANC